MRKVVVCFLVAVAAIVGMGVGVGIGTGLCHTTHVFIPQAVQASQHPSKPAPVSLTEYVDQAPLVPFPSFGPHPKFKVATYHKSPMRSHFGRENLTYYLMQTIFKSESNEQGVQGAMVDIGANHAFFGLYAAAMGRKVVAVEPQKNLVGLIHRSVKANSFEDRVVVRNHAVAMEKTRVSMHRTIGDGGTAMAQVNSSGEVEAIPVAQVLEEEKLGRVSFMKIDVEGYELVALESAMSQLGAVDNIVVEFGPRRRFSVIKDPIMVLNHLHSLSYRAYLISGWCWADYVPLNLLETGSIYSLPVMHLPASKFHSFIQAMQHECMIWWTKTAPESTPLSPTWGEGILN